MVDPARSNRLDPMYIASVFWRDWFPKRGLNDAYIGDRYPLCEDLPEKPFLRVGAKYRLLGGSNKMTWQINHPNADWDEVEAKRFVLNPSSSSLYQKLCVPDIEGACTFPAVVTLDENLDCDGTECNIDRIHLLVSF